MSESTIGNAGSAGNAGNAGNAGKVGNVVRTVTVTGAAATSAPPDRAVLNLGVQARAPSAGEAMEVAARRAGAVIASLRDGGVDSPDLRTAGIGLWHDQHERTYVASHTLSVAVGAGDVGRHIDAAAVAGGDEFTLHGVTFSIADPAPLLAPLRAQAMADARSKAAELAGAEGGSVGDVVTIVEGGGASVPVLKSGPMLRAMSTPVEAGAESLTLQVTVTYELR